MKKLFITTMIVALLPLMANATSFREFFGFGKKDPKQTNAQKIKVNKKETPKVVKKVDKKPKKEVRKVAPSERKVASVDEKLSQQVVRRPNFVSTTKELWVIFAGSYANFKNAQKVLMQLFAKDYPVVMRPIKNKKIGMIYSIQLEPTESKKSAEDLAKHITDVEHIQTKVMRKKILRRTY